ncbi:polypeptide N-acetylgalactosaminyltransferase 1-like [Haliotis cracherodii]|uniref:polypeptide N-acetylgalactosaminyltransferase 1-like n=1 Tax=Haliotis cracherodii TaxID=6455 RepID=UPI0039E7F048
MRIHFRYGLLLGTVFVLLVVGKIYHFVSTTTHRTDSLKRVYINHGHPKDDNALITKYGTNDLRLAGELGRGVVLAPEEKRRAEWAMKKYRLNVYASDIIPLNRLVPDSRPVGCQSMTYPDDLPTTSIVIPFHNEWPSILLRTVYSIINRTPSRLLKEIILVDDESDLAELKEELDKYIKIHLEKRGVKLIRLPKRVGLIKARLEGFKYVTGEVVSFFDSHMEVNVDWLQPLLVEIKRNRSTVAMGHLDYIKADTLQYDFEPGYKTRYGFDWRLVFFETYFRKNQQEPKSETESLPGVVMVGPAFAVDADYFREIGTYDSGMEIWGGENIELAWRVWLCGGQLLHSPCSKIGHIARSQPYSFPAGRYQTEMHNYKRAVEVWMGDYKKYVYEYFPAMKNLDAGDLSERVKLRQRLKCRDFGWFLDNVWPELFAYGEDVFAWGGIENPDLRMCLDNDEYLFQAPNPLTIKPCTNSLPAQGFSWTHGRQLRTTLQCVVVLTEEMDVVPFLQDCIEGPRETWDYILDGMLKHEKTGLCLEVMTGPRLTLQKCDHNNKGQKWRFSQHDPSFKDRARVAANITLNKEVKL